MVSVESMVDAVLKQEPVPDPEDEDTFQNHSATNHYNAYQEQQHDRLDIIEPAEINLDDVWKNVQLPTTGAVIGATEITHEIRVTGSSTKESAVDVPNYNHDEVETRGGTETFELGFFFLNINVIWFCKLTLWVNTRIFGFN